MKGSTYIFCLYSNFVSQCQGEIKFESESQRFDAKETLRKVKESVQSMEKMELESVGCPESCSQLFVNAEQTRYVTG